MMFAFCLLRCNFIVMTWSFAMVLHQVNSNLMNWIHHRLLLNERLIGFLHFKIDWSPISKALIDAHGASACGGMCGLVHYQTKDDVECGWYHRHVPHVWCIRRPQLRWQRCTKCGMALLMTFLCSHTILLLSKKGGSSKGKRWVEELKSPDGNHPLE